MNYGRSNKNYTRAKTDAIFVEFWIVVLNLQRVFDYDAQVADRWFAEGFGSILLVELNEAKINFDHKLNDYFELHKIGLKKGFSWKSHLRPWKSHFWVDCTMCSLPPRILRKQKKNYRVLNFEFAFKI